MTSKFIEGHKSLSNFSVNQTLPNTFIYEFILIKIYMNANIMNMQIFHLNSTSKVIECPKSSSNLDGPLMLLPPNCVDFSLSFSLSLSLFLEGLLNSEHNTLNIRHNFSKNIFLK